MVKTSGGADRSLHLEIAGLVLFAVGVLFFLSLMSYAASDPMWGDLSRQNDYQVQNYLGIVGATVAKPVFESTFGYGALVFPFLMMLLGIFLMIRFSVEQFLKISAMAVAWSYLLSIILGMFFVFGLSKSYYPSGAIGGLTAHKTAQYLGRFALVFLTGIYFLVLLMLTFKIRMATVPIAVGRFTARCWRWLEKSLHAAVASRRGRKVEGRERNSREISDRPHSRVSPLQWLSALVSGWRTRGARSEAPMEENQHREISQHHLPYPRYPESGPSEFSEVGLDDESGLPEEPQAIMETRGDPADTATQFPQVMPGSSPEEALGIAGGGEPGENGPAQQTEIEFERIEEPETDYEAEILEALSKYQMPPADLLHEDDQKNKISREELMANADLLENTLAQFGVKAFVKKVIEGPVITLYAVRPAEGVKINQVVSLSDDLALAMRAKGIRMIAPIPGEAAIGIEIPNRNPSTVYFKSIMRSEKFRDHHGQLILGMGKTISGEVFCADLTRMPHLLIAGSTGSGKSVGINTIIASILYRVPPSDVKFVLIDPKKLELSLYAKLKDHYLATCRDVEEIVITHPQNAILILRSVVNEMEERYDTLAKVGVRDIVSYNQKIEKFDPSGRREENLRKLPYLIVIIDELADLILTASREVEEPITRLAQMARAVGIHLIVATQRPSVDILTGLIKANFPTRIAYQVATRPDSKVILDMYGAEKLIGNGDMLFLPPGTGKPVRLQNPLISTEEVEALIRHIRKQPKFPPYELKLVRNRVEPSVEGTRKYNQDDLFEKAKEIVIRHQQGSISLLQRKLKVGYARAARLIDELEDAGVVGPGQGSKARDVLMSSFSNDDLS